MHFERVGGFLLFVGSQWYNMGLFPDDHLRVVFNNIDAENPKKVFAAVKFSATDVPMLACLQEFWFAVHIDQENVYQSMPSL